MPSALIAQDPAPAAPPAKQEAAGGGGLLGNPLIFLALMALFFLVVLRPASQRQKKEQAQMLATMKAGSRVVTSSGILGTIVKAKDGEDEITIRSEDSRLRVLRSTVVRVLGPDESPEVKA